MKQESQQEIYRVAYEAATSELTEISAEFERLRLRKEQVERLISALQPVIGEDEEDAIPDIPSAQPQAPQLVEAKPATAGEAKGGPAAMVADPFQRRIDHVLGIGAGIRDVRQYTRQF
ncbi:MAG TPA: hypothetical protein VGF82_11300 [Terracidiphilus sp.]|jgi:hypothetical protein